MFTGNHQLIHCTVLWDNLMGCNFNVSVFKNGDYIFVKISTQAFSLETKSQTRK